MKLIKHSLSAAVLSLSVIAANSHATIVEFVTSQGNIRVNLHDETTPETVENFLNYVNDGDYIDSIIHRVEPNFVVQGGGFTYDNGFSHDTVDTDDAVVNEPELSNVSGTIAMAKVSGNANSATSQWFFNVADNSANLDVQNGGFTVFGQVIGDGMEVLTNIQELLLCSTSVGTTPMADYTQEQCTSTETPGYENFVVIYSVDIVDSTTVTDGDLVKLPNTLINAPTTGGGDSGSSGGGSMAWLSPLLALVWMRRRNK